MIMGERIRMRYVVKHTGCYRFDVIDTTTGQTRVSSGQRRRAQEDADRWNKQAQAWADDAAALAQLPTDRAWLVEHTAGPWGTYTVLLRDAKGGVAGVGQGGTLTDAVARALSADH
jgi:hypothetical protein